MYFDGFIVKTPNVNNVIVTNVVTCAGKHICKTIVVTTLIWIIYSHSKVLW